MSESENEANRLFTEDRKKSVPLEEIYRKHSEVGKAIDNYLESEQFEKIAHGKNWEQIKKENEGKLQVIVKKTAIEPLGTGDGKPQIKYMVRDTHDKTGTLDVLGTRSDLIIMIGHRENTPSRK